MEASQARPAGSTTDVKAVPIFAALLTAAFIGMFSEMSLNVALSKLMAELSVTAATIQWLTTGYMLVISILVPVSALLLQTFTTRQLFNTAVLSFIIGTLICAVSPTFAILLTGRLIQAAGTGLLIPLMFNTVLTLTPVHKRGSVMGLIGLVVMFAPAIAPTIAGLIIQKLHWHWLFWVLLPFLVAILLIGSPFMKNISNITKPKIDPLSIVLSTIGFGGVVYGFSSAGEGEHGWTSPTTMFSIIIGIVVLLVFVWRQLKMKQPMLNLTAFKFPMFTIGVVLVMVSMMVSFSFLLLMPMYLQQALLLSTFVAGLVLLPGGVLNGAMSIVTGRLFDKVGPKPLVIPGLIIAIVALWLFTGINTATTVTTIIILHCILQIGTSLVMMPAQTNGLNSLPKSLYPHGTAIMNTLQQLAGAIGTALCVAVMTSGQRAYLAEIPDIKDEDILAKALSAGVNNGFMFALILAAIGLILALFIKKSRNEG